MAPMSCSGGRSCGFMGDIAMPNVNYETEWQRQRLNKSLEQDIVKLKQEVYLEGLQVEEEGMTDMIRKKTKQRASTPLSGMTSTTGGQYGRSSTGTSYESENSITDSSGEPPVRATIIDNRDNIIVRREPEVAGERVTEKKTATPNKKNATGAARNIDHNRIQSDTKDIVIDSISDNIISNNHASRKIVTSALLTKTPSTTMASVVAVGGDSTEAEASRQRAGSSVSTVIGTPAEELMKRQYLSNEQNGQLTSGNGEQAAGQAPTRRRHRRRRRQQQHSSSQHPKLQDAVERITDNGNPTTKPTSGQSSANHRPTNKNSYHSRLERLRVELGTVTYSVRDRNLRSSHQHQQQDEQDEPVERRSQNRTPKKKRRRTGGDSKRKYTQEDVIANDHGKHGNDDGNNNEQRENMPDDMANFGARSEWVDNGYDKQQQSYHPRAHHQQQQQQHRHRPEHHVYEQPSQKHSTRTAVQDEGDNAMNLHFRPDHKAPAAEAQDPPQPYLPVEDEVERYVRLCFIRI
uniref:Uncharacterized protein n=1 Tax=Anopheles maculatus TaxID=74869 RepID=A0A182SAQ6_9DIPT